MKTPPQKKEKCDTAELAAYWGVSRRAVQLWLKAGHPVTKPEEMARVVLNMKRPAEAPKLRAEQIILNRRRKAGDDGSKTTPPKETNEGAEPPKIVQVTDEDVERAEVNLDKLRKYCWVHMEKAREMGNTSDVSFWSEKLIRAEKAIRDSELHAKKMGLEDGEFISRADMCRLLHAMAFWMVQGIDKDLAAVCPKLLGCTYVEEAYAILDRFLLRKRFLATFARAATYPCGAQLPRWLVDGLRDGVDDYYENGGPIFDRYMELFGQASEPMAVSA